MLLVIPFLLLSAAAGSEPCAGPCLCDEPSGLVDCRLGGLLRVPHGLPRGSWLLDLSGNGLTDVRSKAFAGLWSLKVLVMSNNSIGSLQPQSLSSLQFLEKLDLSFNRLHHLPRGFSQGLSSLLELRLGHNLLQQLDPASLGDLENLRTLDLGHNRIDALDGGAFTGLSRLVLLNLEGNRLSVLRDGLLSRQQSMKVLLLGHNNVSRIEPEALTPLRSLTLLGLRGNQLERIRFKTFLQLRTTSTHLRMSRNPWICDCDLQRVFGKIHRVRHLHVEDYKDIRCHSPAQQAGLSLASLDSRLCVAETASVLIITITVLLAVVGTLVKAEHNRKNKQSVSDAESQGLER